MGWTHQLVLDPFYHGICHQILRSVHPPRKATLLENHLIFNRRYIFKLFFFFFFSIVVSVIRGVLFKLFLWMCLITLSNWFLLLALLLPSMIFTHIYIWYLHKYIYIFIYINIYIYILHIYLFQTYQNLKKPIGQTLRSPRPVVFLVELPCAVTGWCVHMAQAAVVSTIGLSGPWSWELNI